MVLWITFIGKLDNTYNLLTVELWQIKSARFKSSLDTLAENIPLPVYEVLKKSCV